MTALRTENLETALFLDTPLISTERLVLRPPHVVDAEPMAQLAWPSEI